jgi:hypothetical protein
VRVIFDFSTVTGGFRGRRAKRRARRRVVLFAFFGEMDDGDEDSIRGRWFAGDPRARTGQKGSVAFALALAHTRSFAT